MRDKIKKFMKEFEIDDYTEGDLESKKMWYSQQLIIEEDKDGIVVLFNVEMSPEISADMALSISEKNLYIKEIGTFTYDRKNGRILYDDEAKERLEEEYREYFVNDYKFSLQFDLTNMDPDVMIHC